MKVAIITDTHYGIRNDNPIFYSYFEKFLENHFWPEINKRGIKEIWHLGDMIDRRKYINFQTMEWVDKKFISKLDEYDLTMKLIIGNHDSFYKHTLQLNSPELLFGSNPRVKLMTEPTSIDNFLFLPWITQSNQKKTLDMIENTDSKIVMGHLEIMGYLMFKGTINSTGSNPDLYRRFQSVYSGHFHVKSKSQNITYLGCPWDLIFTDADDTKGFHIYDTEEDTLEPIENPYKMYYKFMYDDGNTESYVSTVKPIIDGNCASELKDLLKDRYLRVTIKHKTDPVSFDKYVKALNAAEPIDLTFIDDYTFQSAQGEELQSLGEDTLSIMKSSIEDYSHLISSDDKKEKIEKLLSELYVEALNL